MNLSRGMRALPALAASALVGTLLVAAAATPGHAEDVSQPQPVPVQAAYYAGWEQAALPPASLPWSKITHVIHFSVLPTATGGLDDTTNGVTAGKAGALVQEAHSRGKKVLISVGGTPGSQNWPTVASASNRERFVSNLVGFMASRQYDGVDLNWEGAVNEADYLATMQALRTALDSRGKGELLTAAYFGSWADLARASSSLLDWVTMMSYLPYGQPADSHNSPVYGRAYARIDNLVNLWLQAGVPKNKIVFGFATYASVWSGGSLVTPELPYREAVARGYSAGLSWDATAEASFRQSGTTFVSMESATSVTAKVAYRQTRGLGGLVVWELGAGRLGTSVPLTDSLPEVSGTTGSPAPTTSPAPTSSPVAPSAAPTATATTTVTKRPPGKKR